MNGAQRQFVVPVHNLGTGRGERFLPHEVIQHTPEHIDGGILNAGTHGHHAEIGCLGNEGCHERFVEMGRPRLMPLDGCEVAAKTGELIDLHQ